MDCAKNTVRLARAASPGCDRDWPRAWQCRRSTISEVVSMNGEGLPMRLATALFALAASAIVAAWAWLGAAVQMPPSPLAPGEKLYCVSYAPFRAGQDPFGPDIPIDPRQIEEDLAQLKRDHRLRAHLFDRPRARPDPGNRQAPRPEGAAGACGCRAVPDLTRKQIDTGIALAKRFPDVIQAVIVGNEVLLRGEMSAARPRRGSSARSRRRCRCR